MEAVDIFPLGSTTSPNGTHTITINRRVESNNTLDDPDTVCTMRLSLIVAGRDTQHSNIVNLYFENGNPEAAGSFRVGDRDDFRSCTGIRVAPAVPFDGRCGFFWADGRDTELDVDLRGVFGKQRIRIGIDPRDADPECRGIAETLLLDGFPTEQTGTWTLTAPVLSPGYSVECSVVGRGLRDGRVKPLRPGAFGSLSSDAILFAMPADGGGVPGAPTGLTLTAGDAMLSARWAAPVNSGGSAITGYRVQWRTATENWGGEARETGTTTTSHDIVALTNNTTYGVRVAAVNARGRGAWSAEATGVPSAVVVGGGDRDALIALYNATGGASWSNNTNWLSGEPISTWYGVATDGAGRVTHLRLQDNGLSGRIPAELAALELVTHLWLNHNDLAGPIPMELGGLANLGHFSVDANRRLTGRVPASFGSLWSLWTLRLEQTALAGALPQGLTNLRNLRHLSMHDSSLCAPDNEEFRMWVEALSFFSGRYCGAVPALPPVGVLLLSGLLVLMGVGRLTVVKAKRRVGQRLERGTIGRGALRRRLGR